VRVLGQHVRGEIVVLVLAVQEEKVGKRLCHGREGLKGWVKRGCGGYVILVLAVQEEKVIKRFCEGMGGGEGEVGVSCSLGGHGGGRAKNLIVGACLTRRDGRDGGLPHREGRAGWR
jgi:hypothetical protein